jgi:hypothetical protein
LAGVGCACRCFPKFPPELTSAVIKVLNSSSGVAADAASVLKESWSSSAGTWSTYVADISKGILIIVIAGLGGGIVLSLVSDPRSVLPLALDPLGLVHGAATAIAG